MPPLTVLHLPNLQAFRHQAERWDDLWRRSPVTHPTSQAALIVNWLEHFCPGERFQAVVVCQEGRFVAGIPLLPRRKRHLISCLDVPGNEWSSAGQLLLDPAVEIPVVCDLLIETLSQLSCPVYWFASVPSHAPAWQALSDAAHRAGWKVACRARYQVGKLELADTWSDQRTMLSKGLRKQLRRSMRRLESLGSLQLRCALPGDWAAALPLLERGLQVEHAGWKGVARTSLVANPRAAHFARDQAAYLATQRQLALVSLELDGRSVAFEYGWLAKQVYHSYKVGYDPRFRAFGPGHILLYLLLQRFHAGGEARAIDFLGPLDGATMRWSRQSYRMGRLLLAPPRPLSTAIVIAARHLSSDQPPHCAPAS